MNLNTFADEVAIAEKKTSKRPGTHLPIGQVKQVIRITFELLKKYSDDEIITTIRKPRKGPYV